METSKSSNPSHVLMFVYLVLAISATVRGAFQIATKWSEAPLAYTLTTVAAMIYGLASFGFSRRSPSMWKMTVAVCAFELLGVLAVGVLTLVEPTWFPDATVWSNFGIDYAFAPLLLPIASLIWLTRPTTRRAFGLSAA